MTSFVSTASIVFSILLIFILAVLILTLTCALGWVVALVAARLLNKDEEPQVEQELEEKYQHLREEYQQEQQQLVSLDEARQKKKDFFIDNK